MATVVTTQTLFKEIEDKMKKALATLTREFSEIRGGRATPALVEHITVEYYGTPTPLKQLAAITAPEPSLLVIQPWDAKAVQDIEKAILKASLGINPVVEGKLVRLPIPPLTGERREELTKVVHRMAEEGRVNIRTIRRDANETVKKLKTDKQISEDESFKAQDHVQKLTDKYIASLDQLVKSKEQELHSV
ncbi:MAG: ribosome recycling factor [Candidatus Omnitrophica bacterium]|nr:ribosome recycling factor [Candidatus Omnitrophota bacterium]